MAQTLKDSEGNKLVKDKETGEYRPRLQEPGPGRPKQPREKKAGYFKFVPFDESEGVAVVGTTKKGKEVRIKREKPNGFSIYFYPGGPVPKFLSGRYSDYLRACEKARLYIEAYV